MSEREPKKIDEPDQPPKIGPAETRGFPILVYSLRLKGYGSNRLKSDPAECVSPMLTA